jgi:predicted DNA-binding protein
MIRLDVPVAFRLHRQDRDKLKELADNSFCSVSTYCRDVIREHIDKEES